MTSLVLNNQAQVFYKSQVSTNISETGTWLSKCVTKTKIVCNLCYPYCTQKGQTWVQYG